MEFQLSFKVNNSICLRDPESSELGRQMVKKSIDLIYELGFEAFTFKKLATEIHTTEATVYRYFENKHRLLLYIVNWYWSYMEFLVMFKLQNLRDSKEKLITVVDLLTHELPESVGHLDYNKKYINHIVIAESSKVYLVKEVGEINKNDVFKAYKDLCGRIADIIRDCNPDYRYPRSLSSTLVEVAHQQQFFSVYLPKLTDDTEHGQESYTAHFLEDLLIKVLG